MKPLFLLFFSGKILQNALHELVTVIAVLVHGILGTVLICVVVVPVVLGVSAFRRRAVSYITKPYSFSDIFEALERAKLLCSEERVRIRVRTFGHFDIFVNDTLLKFPRQKCKELLAFFVDEDLMKTDQAAMECIPKERRGQDMDNWIWIRDAEKNNLVVGTQARNEGSR